MTKNDYAWQFVHKWLNQLVIVHVVPRVALSWAHGEHWGWDDGRSWDGPTAKADLLKLSPRGKWRPLQIRAWAFWSADHLPVTSLAKNPYTPISLYFLSDWGPILALYRCMYVRHLVSPFPKLLYRKPSNCLALQHQINVKTSAQILTDSDSKITNVADLLNSLYWNVICISTPPPPFNADTRNTQNARNKLRGNKMNGKITGNRLNGGVQLGID